ncbi:MATE family efflux transporter [Jannaschia sp. LMIT008]|uniref:MATE family efflux transporter n=1 Tax=Jannaschia maritima TaxID=3032585 RepID=UPI002811EB6F|nr:MATE family efflux transporter [Jannaschia sp. LMIT008]
MTRTLTLGLPLVGSQVAQMLIGLTDTLMLGRYSVPALAAGTLGATFFFTLFLLTSGFAYGIIGLSSDAAGRGDERGVRRAARMGLWLAVLAGLAAMPIMFLSGPILTALGQPADVVIQAEAYLRIVALGLVPALFTVTIRSHLSALERTRIVLWVTLAGVALNVGLNAILIFGAGPFPELGVRGAAWASVGVNVAMGAMLALYAARGPGMARWELFRNPLRPDWQAFGQVFRLGWPIGLTHVSESGLFAASALMMGNLGTRELAAHGIAIQIAGATFMVHLGLSQAATVRVGRYAGQGDRGGLRDAAVAAFALSGIAVALAMALYWFAGGTMVGAFLDPGDPQAATILSLGVGLLLVAGLFQLVDAGQVMALGCLRGLQDTKRPMIYAVLAYWGCGIPVSYLFGFHTALGAYGVWLGLCVGLAVAAILLTVRFWRLVADRDARPIRLGSV